MTLNFGGKPGPKKHGRASKKTLRKRKDLERSIQKILNGSSSNSFKGISVIKNKRDQNLLRNFVKENRGSGIDADTLKSVLGLNDNYGGLSKGSLKQSQERMQQGQKVVNSTANLVMERKLAANRGDDLGDPPRQLLESIGEDPEEFDLRKIENALDAEIMNRTPLLELVQKNYEKIYPWAASWLLNNLDKFRKVEY